MFLFLEPGMTRKTVGRDYGNCNRNKYFLLHETFMKYIFLKLFFSFFAFLSQYIWSIKVIAVEGVGKNMTESVE